MVATSKARSTSPLAKCPATHHSIPLTFRPATASTGRHTIRTPVHRRSHGARRPHRTQPPSAPLHSNQTIKSSPPQSGSKSASSRRLSPKPKPAARPSRPSSHTASACGSCNSRRSLPPPLPRSQPNLSTQGRKRAPPRRASNLWARTRSPRARHTTPGRSWAARHRHRRTTPASQHARMRTGRPLRHTHMHAACARRQRHHHRHRRRRATRSRTSPRRR